ncbi:hypothetical protein JCM3765_004626 [Sporobolomyces pararoseus]
MPEEARKRSLPDELLEQIFSSPRISQHQLGMFCSLSKRFSAIVRPILYRSIILGNHEHVEKLRNFSREEDLRLVQSVRIFGEGDAREVFKSKGIHESFEEMDENEKLLSEAGLVRKLIEGEIIVPKQLKWLSIYQVIEDPAVSTHGRFLVIPRIFANLAELSIVSYRGGFNIVSKLLSRRSLPNLERLTLCDMTEMTAFPVQQVLNGRNLLPGTPQDHDEALETHLERSDLLRDDKLRLLVSRRFEFLDEFPSLVHLTTVMHADHLDETIKYAVLYSSNPSAPPHQFISGFSGLQVITIHFDSSSLRYLSLPSHLSGELLPHMQQTLDTLIDLGVSVHFDANLGRSIAPPSFFEFRRKEQEMEAMMASMSVDES